MDLREATDLDFCEADRSLRQLLARSRGDSSIAAELWIERFLNRLATGFNHGLSQAIPTLEASLWQRLADELSQALGDTIAIAFPTPDPNQFEVQHSAFVSNPPASCLESGSVITQSKLKHLQAQGWQSAWRIDDASSSIAWLIAVPLSLTIEGGFWDDYTTAYEDALGATSAPHAPWYIVPADHKWFRNVAVATALVETLRPYKAGWQKSLEAIGKQRRAELAAMRTAKGAKE